MLTNNRCYTNPKIINPTGIMIHSVGCNQPNKEVFAKNWNNQKVSKGVHAMADNKGVMQFLPYNYKSWHCGGSANNTHLSIEMTEPSCLIYTGRGAEIKSYDVEEGYKHFKSTLDNTINWTADRCIEFNIPVDKIICHADGYKLGIASNHADVYHWWRFHNYDMDDFRQAVYNKINKKDRFNTVDECPEWTRKYITDLIRLGYISGYNGKLDLDIDMIRCLIIAGRMAGVF